MPNTQGIGMIIMLSLAVFISIFQLLKQVSYQIINSIYELSSLEWLYLFLFISLLFFCSFLIKKREKQFQESKLHLDKLFK